MNRCNATLRALLAAALLAAPAAIHADEPVLLNDGASGMLQLEGENTLEIQGVNFTLALRVARDGELRYSARARSDRREERNVALWLDGRTLKLGALPGDEADGLILEVAAAPQLLVELALAESKVNISGLANDLRFDLRNVDLTARALSGSVSGEAEGGTLSWANVEGDFEIEAEKSDVRLSRIAGEISLQIDEGVVSLDESNGPLDADLENTKLTCRGLQGAVDLRASGGGAVELNGLRRGGRMELDDTTLALNTSRGPFDVESNSEVRFNQLEGGLTVNGFGTRVRGIGNKGKLEVGSDGAEVTVENLEGPAKIEGDSLTVHTKSTKGLLMMNCTSSRILIENAAEEVQVTTDFGELKIRRADKKVTINSRDAGIDLAEMKGAVELRADTPLVQVAWAAFVGEENSLLENPGGDVRVTVPGSAGGKVQAEAPYGRIESDLPNITVSDDGNEAAGLMGRSRSPVLRINSGGDIYIGTRQGAGQ
ncbi:MAG: hypothetical protein GY716_02085 [bacterium]|nr:hypothetical protein [bacterium]